MLGASTRQKFTQVYSAEGEIYWRDFLDFVFLASEKQINKAFKSPSQDFLWISGENLILSPRYFTVLDLQTQGGLYGQLALSLQLFLMKKSALEIT